MLKSLAHVGIAIAITLTTVVAAAGVAPPASSNPNANLALPYELRVISHNMEGCPGGHLGDPQYTASLKAQINNWTSPTNVKVVGLQEVGWLQYQDLVNTYDNAGWDLRFESLRRTGPVSDPNSQAKTNPECTYGPAAPYQQGQVLMVRGTMSNYSVTDVPFGEYSSDGDKFFTLQCGEFTVAGVTQTIRACNTHLAVKLHDDANLNRKKAQLQTIRELTDAYVATKIVVLTGDFNIDPQSQHMSKIYRLTLGGTHTGEGQFREADQTDPAYCPPGGCRDMEPTRGTTGKIDYVFFNRQFCDNTTLAGGVIDSPSSDHHIKRGRCDVS